MIYVALAELVVILVLIYVITGMWKDTMADKRRAEVNLLSVLGKTETVALHLRDERPPGEVRYVDDEAMANGKRE